MSHYSPVRRLQGTLTRRRTALATTDLALLPRHHRIRSHVALILAVVVLVFFGFRSFQVSSYSILEGGSVAGIQTTLGDGEEALRAAGIPFEAGDELRFASTGGDLASISVSHATEVVLEVDGVLVQLRTRANTVGGALAEAGVPLGHGDLVFLDGQHTTADAPLAADRATVSRVAPGRTSNVAAPVGISVVRARPVAVHVDNYRIETRSAAGTVREVLAGMGLSVREGDLVAPGLDAPVEAGMVVRLANARTITVIVDGVEETLYTQAATVADVLDVLGIEPGPDDLLEPGPATRIVSGSTVTVGLTREVTESVEEAIKPEIVYESDTSIPAGSVQVVPGADGLLRRDYRVTYRNGEEIERVEIGTTVVTAAVPTRHLVGASSSTSSSPILDTPEYTGPYRDSVRVWATWYNASHGGRPPSDPNYGMTYTGIMVEHGVCAVDPSVIPLGTRFFVPGYGTCLAADIGGGVKGYHVDLGFPESAPPHPWATGYVEIYILE